jgi:hypothetical protein
MYQTLPFLLKLFVYCAELARKKVCAILFILKENFHLIRLLFIYLFITQRKKYKDPQGKIFDQWRKYESKEKTGAQVLRVCAKFNVRARNE